MPLTLDYRVTRTFKWRWFAPLAFLGAFITLVFLILINIPLTGYETVTTFQDDFNATEWHWFYRFMPFRIPKPGSTCDPHVFKVGDPFTTNYSFFEWNIDSIIQPNAGNSAISYTGTPLTFCDVTSIYVNGDLHSWNVDFTVVVACEQNDLFKVTAKTSFSMGLLPGRYSPLLGMVRYYNDGTNDTRGLILDSGIRAASTDLGTRAYNAFVGSGSTTPMIISLHAGFAYCPMSLGPAAACAITAPKFAIRYAAAVYANASILQYDNNYAIDPVQNPWVLDADTEQPIVNLLQTIYASIRVDLGNPSLNNFILHPLFLNSTIIPVFPATRWNQDNSSRNATLYDGFAHLEPDLSVNVSGPAHIQVVYPCRFQQRKSLGSLVISVLVATLSMFSSGWALFILIATALAKRADPLGTSAHCYWIVDALFITSFALRSQSMRWPL
ncbi:hypothetical protein BDZ97DRAFT_1655514 [Flammula alnicola]|nr:hypothetical protein BDZ97DRAFT_1655514 [Flammula alnicola]